ncbi:MAG: pseudaminic acid cytidylyltransferase [Eubacteriales bacterium]
MNAIAIITARGGSKRIPRKNIKEFLGKPIIEYSIDAALQSKLFEEVMVSTDDEEIADIARKAGAVVPFYRSANTSNDFATTADVILEVLAEYEKLGQRFEYVCCLYPTAPFIKAKRLEEGMLHLEREGCDGVIPIVAYSFPPQRSVVVREGRIKANSPDDMRKRSQDLETYYHDSGQFYCVRVDAFVREKSLMMENTQPIILSELEVQDIDTQKDWEVAELKYQLMNG